MSFFSNLFTKRTPKNPEDDFKVTFNDTFIRIEHPERKTEQVLWKNIQEIKLINTDRGPWLPDIWLVLIGDGDGCLIPQGAKGFEEIYNIVSKYEGFNFENFIKSMACTENAEFDLWIRP